MKKIFIASLSLLFAAAPAFALAASLSLSPNSGNYTAGHSYSVSIYVNPAGSSIYTAKVQVDYPAKLLQVTGFTPASNVMSLAQPGYDSIDNTNGVLIKTVGFPNGVSTTALIGTITFQAKASGTATVSISSANSQALDVNIQNAATSFGTASYTIAEPASQTPQKTVTKAATTQTIAQKQTTAPTTTESTTTSVSIATATQTPATSSQVAAAASAGANVLDWVLWAISVLVAFGLGYLVGNRRRF